MRIEPLLSFCAVVEQGTFHKAAAALYLTQPAVSMNIKQLEKEFGQPLFTREGRGKIVLTPFGEKLYELSHGLREQMDQLEMLKQETLRQNRFEIIIDCHIPAGIYLLTPFSAKFQEENPDIHISINHTKSEQAIQNLMDGRSDLVMLLSPKFHPQLQSVTIWEDEMKIIVPPDNPLTQTSLTLKDLENQHFILPPKGVPSRFFIDEIFKKHFGKPADSLMEVGNQEALKKSVVSINKPGIILTSAIQNELQLNMLKALSTELKMNCQHILFYKKNRFLPESILRFTKFIMERSNSKNLAQ